MRCCLKDCQSLTSITIPEGVTCIGVGAFSGCSSLTSITIPEGVTSIGNWTFEDCQSLTSITIPEGVTSIGERAFYGCESLINHTIPANIIKTDVPVVLDITGLEGAGEIFEDALDMLREKDFARKFSHKVKFKLILDYFFATEDEDAKAYLKKSTTKGIKQLIDNGDVPRLQNLLDKTEFVTKRNIDKFIEYAIEKQQQELFVILTNYKNQIGAYKTPEEEFKL